MSIQAVAWALSQQVITDPPARFVLVSLANYAGLSGQDAFPSTATISRETGLSDRTVRRKLDELVTVGLISVGNQAVAAAKIKNKGTRPVCYDLNIAEHPVPVGPKRSNTVQSLPLTPVSVSGVEKPAPLSQGPAPLSATTVTPVSLTADPEEGTVRGTEEAPSAGDLFPGASADIKAERAGQIERVFKAWTVAHSTPRSALNGSRRELIRKRLTLYTEEDLIQAIVGYSLSPFHMGENDRNQKYNSLELILRNPQKIEAGIEFFQNPPKPRIPLTTPAFTRHDRDAI